MANEHIPGCTSTPDIRVTIAQYMQGKTEPSEGDLICFVGMMKTGDATLGDFLAVGGNALGLAVRKKIDPDAAYEQATFDALAIIDTLHNALVEHRTAPGSDGIDWGDVGDMKQIKATASGLYDRITGGGEYA